jgi:sigma-B regulation protein RsbU (phosphoserine phosphatase)
VYLIKKNKKAFNKSDLSLLLIISNHIVEAYKSLLSKEQEKKLEAINRDLQIAAKIQMYSLPAIPKSINGLEVETLYLSSKEIGGDFYDMIYHTENEISAIIADVSGKGISAALFMEFSKNDFGERGITIILSFAKSTQRKSHYKRKV